MPTAPTRPADAGASRPGALSPAERARGRRIVIATHPLGMTHHRVFTAELPTLALLGLGAGDAVVGFQRSLEPLLQVLRLPTLRATARWRMRSILVAGQGAALACALPLVFYGGLRTLEPPRGLALAVASLFLCNAALAIAQTVWFPLLYHYPEPGQTGRFFGIVRTGWHAALIVYFLAAQRWLAAHPGRFGALFAVGWACGLVRSALLVRLPERARPAEAPPPPRLREPFRDARFRRYIAAIALGSGARRAAAPFAIVLLRRHLGLSDADLVVATLATYAGGLVSLYAWGIAADRFGTRPVFRATAFAGAAATLGLLALPAAGSGTLALATALFFLSSISASGFDVADTNLIFRIAPSPDPTTMLVTGSVTINVLTGLAPLAAGLALDAALAAGAAPEAAYGTLFVLCAALQVAALVPLRVLDRG